MVDSNRIRLDGVENYLANQLEPGVTNITFARPLVRDGGALVDTLLAGEYLVLSILDANYVLREIVYLTSYQKAQTFGTIARGQEGTGDMIHAAGAKVVHASTAEDFLSVLSHEKNPDSHKDQIIAIATGIAQGIMAAHLAAVNPHPQYALRGTSGGPPTVFDGDVIFNGNVTINGVLTISEEASLDVYGTLQIMAPTGKIKIHGKQLIISNTEPSAALSNTVWIQTFGA